MHEIELHPWPRGSRLPSWDGGLAGDQARQDDLHDLLAGPGGEARLRAALEPELGSDDSLTRAALPEATVDLLDQGRLVMGSSLSPALAVDPLYPTGDESQDLGNLIDLMDRRDEDEPEPERPSWIEIAVVDARGEPIRGRAYRLELPDGTVRRGTLGDEGLIRFDDVDPGLCTLELLDDADDDASEPAEPALAA
ncbi:MAG: hypothetical protein KDK70_28290 [Myxococcales bacterium]|nr:hypothetical protein [Myxococcales bacterium]